MLIDENYEWKLERDFMGIILEIFDCILGAI